METQITPKEIICTCEECLTEQELAPLNLDVCLARQVKRYNHEI